MDAGNSIGSGDAVGDMACMLEVRRLRRVEDNEADGWIRSRAKSEMGLVNRGFMRRRRMPRRRCGGG